MVVARDLEDRRGIDIIDDRERGADQLQHTPRLRQTATHVRQDKLCAPTFRLNFSDSFKDEPPCLCTRETLWKLPTTFPRWMALTGACSTKFTTQQRPNIQASVTDGAIHALYDVPLLSHLDHEGLHAPVSFPNSVASRRRRTEGNKMPPVSPAHNRPVIPVIIIQ